MGALEGFLLHWMHTLVRSTQLVIRDDPNGYFSLETGVWSSHMW
jgi:hypothetical protein